MINLKSHDDIDLITRGGAIIGGLFREVEGRVVPGVSTSKLDRFCEDYIRSHEGAVPAFKGLYGFPGSVCISINEEVVHGLPSSSRILAERDIVSIDVGVRLEGWCSDSAWTFAVGDIDEETRNLLRVTEDALERAIEAACPGNHVGDIGAAVVSAVEGTGLGIVRELVGHGVGREVHEEPQVPNVGRAGFGPLLREGLVLAIEPMLSTGTDAVRTLEDGWTVITADGSKSAHFEHTVAITAAEPRILTLAPVPTGGVGPFPA
ncbi:MAG TPA: type I methionyl aminopeptidase [Gemmatimonadetes bacterium]|nr:type I methionyl aminopeptidase [Gemmatimonadota bacterium]|tara:strand:+ start:304 stop:1092 length:789 start_codon:yes stop_codon:yes gene_type:complete